MPDSYEVAAGLGARRLFAFNTGILFPGRVRRMLTLSGLSPRLGRPGPNDFVGVWGRSPTAHRGETAAKRSGAALVRIEDAFLRSINPGRAGDAPLGLLIDHTGIHFDGAAPSDLERMLATNPIDDHALLTRARDGMARLRLLEISKYNSHDLSIPLPEPGYVLVLDQLRDDASVRFGGANPQTFREMLVQAQLDHPGQRILVKSHPETILGLRPGHYQASDSTGNVSILSSQVPPYALLEGAVAVYTVSSQMGFEAILAGHKPHVFGQPFYAGWGLTYDEAFFPRRRRTLTKTQLFAAAMILAPVWYDPCRDRLCQFEEIVDALEAEVRALREDRAGYVALGMRRWKRPALQGFFGRTRKLRFVDDAQSAARYAAAEKRSVLVWANREPADIQLPMRRVEDGFIRSRGLGARLIPPLSLISDDLGIYYDPTRENRLDRIVANGPPPGGETRAERLLKSILASGLTKYNLGGVLPALPQGHLILVPGQVEDDASIVKGATAGVRSNLELLSSVRSENPTAVVLYKPHPDVVAGLRKGHVSDADACSFADLILTEVDPAALLEVVDEVWTMTSLLGFEAILRGVAVTCLGTPFYAGWGLTKDRGHVPEWRKARPNLHSFVHATLIAYPRYRDPVSGLPCPPEVVVERLASGLSDRPGLTNRTLSRLQRLFVGHSGFRR
jgi:capsular polysaccharide export protein